MTKTILILTIIISLTSCRWLPFNFTDNEYEFMAILKSDIETINKNCTTDHVDAQIAVLKYDADVLYSYSKHIPQNDEIINPAHKLKNDIDNFKHQYKIGKGNPIYCLEETNMLLKEINELTKTVTNTIPPLHNN